MPLAWRVHVIDARLKAAGVDALVGEADMYGLRGDERSAVMDAMVAGAEFPLVLVNGKVLCQGGVEMGQVVEAARAAG